MSSSVSKTPRLAHKTPRKFLAKKKKQPKKQIVASKSACHFMRLFQAAIASFPREYSPDSPYAELQRGFVRSIFRDSLSPGETFMARLPLGIFAILSHTSIIDTIYAIVNSNIPGFSEWATIFSQYRIVRADLHYTPYFKGSATNTGLICAGIEYGTTVTAITSLTAAEQLDDFKVVTLCDKMSWTIDILKGYGVIDWWDVSASPVYCCWKSYMDSNSGIGSATYYGVIGGHVDVEFKGLQ